MWPGWVRWIGQLLTLAVVFALLDLLQPEGSLKGAVRTVMGLAMVAAVLGPAVGLVEDAATWGALLQRWQEPAATSAAGPPPAVDVPALSQTLWREVLGATYGRLRSAVAGVLDREGLRLAQLRWDSSGTGGRLLVVVEPGPVAASQADRLRRELARALELDPVQVEVRVADPGGSDPAAGGRSPARERDDGP